MQAEGARPEWVVCHQVMRSAAGLLVRCPQRGQVLSDDCLRCRFLTTSSVERTFGPWCEADPALSTPSVEQPLTGVRSSWPLSLPQLVPVGPGIAAEPAVRPAAPVPSGQPIGT